MAFRISPIWWPLLAVLSPAIVPWLLIGNRRFERDRTRAAELNRERLSRAELLEMPPVDDLELTVLVEWKHLEGFLGDAGVSYWLKTELGSVLYDVGFGPASPTLAHNAAKVGLHLDRVEALAVSHLHLDHMGGMAAQRARHATMPAKLMPSRAMPCFVPDRAEAAGFAAELVERPRPLAGGIATTGPLARSLFLFGFTEEQALLARVKDKGLVVFVGCCHPGIEVVLGMARRLSGEPLYVICGGLHFPVTEGRAGRAGIDVQTLVGADRPPWQRVTDNDLSQAISIINDAGPKRVYLSGHDTCDHALDRMVRELHAEAEVLKTGETYRL